MTNYNFIRTFLEFFPKVLDHFTLKWPKTSAIFIIIVCILFCHDISVINLAFCNFCHKLVS